MPHGQPVSLQEHHLEVRSRPHRRRRAVHDGRQALGAVPASGALHEALTVSISSDDSALRLDMIGDMAVCA
jgi:hypothetical protein